jgi:hypothetical protein
MAFARWTCKNFGVIAKRLGAFVVRHVAMTLLAVYDRMAITFQGEKLLCFPSSSQRCGLKQKIGYPFAYNLLIRQGQLLGQVLINITDATWGTTLELAHSVTNRKCSRVLLQ